MSTTPKKVRRIVSSEINRKLLSEFHSAKSNKAKRRASVSSNIDAIETSNSMVNPDKSVVVPEVADPVVTTATEKQLDTTAEFDNAIVKNERDDAGVNAIPGFEVLGLKKICGTSDYMVTLLFENPKIGLKETVSLSMAEVKSAAKFRKKIPPGFTPPYKPSKIIEDLQYDIYQALNSPDFMIGYALPQGFSFIENELFYVIGDCVLPVAAYEKERSVSSNKFIAESYGGAKLFLPISEVERIKLERAFGWVVRYCQQGPAQTVLFLCAMSPYMKYIMPESFSEGSAVTAFVVGESGFGKTEQIKLLARITDGYGLNLESDMKEIWAGLADFRDRAVQLDDLNKTSSNAIKENKEKKVYSLLQVGDSAAGKVCSKEVNVDLSNTALLFSAEYAIQSHSAKNRAVLLYIREAFNSEVLTWLQKNRAFYIRFLVHFISMICCNCEELKSILTEYHDSEPFQIPNVDAAEEYEGFQRVFRHYKILRLTAYAIECCISDSEKRDELRRMFKEGTDICIKDTLEALRKSAVKDFVKSFLCIFERDIVAESPKEYCCDEKYFFFLHKDYIYFRGKDLTDYFLKVYSQTISTKTISKELGNVGLLVMYGNSYSEKLSKKLDEKAGGKGEHYYRINTNVLIDMLYNSHDLISYLGIPIVRILKNRDNEAEKEKKKKKDKKKNVVIDETMYLDTY